MGRVRAVLFRAQRLNLSTFDTNFARPLAVAFERASCALSGRARVRLALSCAVDTGRRRRRRTRLLLKEVISSVIPALLRVWRVGPSASTVPAFQYTRGVTRASVSVKSLSGKDCNVGGRPEPSLSFSHGIDSESQSIYCRMQSRRNPRSEHSRAKTKTFNVTSERAPQVFVLQNDLFTREEEKAGKEEGRDRPKAMKPNPTTKKGRSKESGGRGILC